MDKSSITCTSGSDWWLSRTTMEDKERYPKQIRVGDLDRPRVYYPVDRDALLALADELSGDTLDVPAVYGTYLGGYVAACRDAARRIREALGVSDDA